MPRDMLYRSRPPFTRFRQRNLRENPDAEAERLAEDPAEIRYRAACSFEEHAIKFSEACLRENALCPDPALRIAAADAALHL